jgi:3'-phosphoadenosine 5'-phosphosulfate sulfotransferase (PAPS reductase)/FAD synthetase
MARQQSLLKLPLGIDVLTAARERITQVLEAFPRVYVSFSGGKDSTVLLHLVVEEAAKRGRRIGVLFIDWEAQYQLTIEHVREMLALYGEHIEPIWSCLPLTTTNACSMHEPEWICWDERKRDRWVRELPAEATLTADRPPAFYSKNMTFEEFIEQFGHWYGQGQPCCAFVGIRTDESLNRFRSLRRNKGTWNGRPWTTWMGRHSYNAYRSTTGGPRTSGRTSGSFGSRTTACMTSCTRRGSQSTSNGSASRTATSSERGSGSTT